MSKLVINLESQNTAATPMSYDNRLEEDRVDNANADKVGAYIGNTTASFSTRFFVSGTVSNNLTTVLASYSPINRILTEVVAFSAQSGSGGVTRFDVQRQEDGVGGAFRTVFSNNVYKPILSASAGTFTPVSTKTFSGSLWPAGTLLKVLLDSAAVLQSDVTLEVFWRPSASYGV